MTFRAKITGTGAVLPLRRVSNAELADELAKRGIVTSDEWIVSRSGISFRHFVDAGIKTSDLAATAAQRALEAAGLEANEIGLILVATSTPDYFGGFPSTACIVQAKLGINNGCAAFDLQAVCSGFAYALTVGDQFIRSGMYRHVLVIGAETFSRILDFNDRSTCVLFGDGAGAVVLSASSEPGVIATAMHADGQQHHILCVPGSLEGGIVQGKAFLHMDGPAVFKLAVNALDKVANEVLQAARMTADEIDWLLPHQANLRIMQGTAKKLGMPMEKIIVSVDQHGNTSAASIPLALDMAVRDGRVKAGQYLLLEGVGGGFTWAAAVIKM